MGYASNQRIQQSLAQECEYRKALDGELRDQRRQQANCTDQKAPPGASRDGPVEMGQAGIRWMAQ
jgi:hypothetical protein